MEKQGDMQTYAPLFSAIFTFLHRESDAFRIFTS